MKIKFLGTGTSQGVPVIACRCRVCRSSDPRDNRLRCSILVSKGDTNVIVDTGPDFRQQALLCGLDQLSAALITHEHNDHIIGLDDIRPFNFMTRRELNVYARPKVGDEIKKRFAYIFSKKPYPGAPKVNLKSFENNISFNLGDIDVFPIEVMHGKMPVTGFVFNKFAYVTDAKEIRDDQKAYLKDLDVLVLNALHKDRHHSHLTLEEAVNLALELRVKKCYLTHISHKMGLHADVEKELPEHIFLAHDGLEIEI